MLTSCRDILEMRNSIMSAGQFAPLCENEAEAVVIASDKAWRSYNSFDDTVTVGRSTEDRNVIIVDGAAYTMCCIPFASDILPGYYEVVIGRNKRPAEEAIDFRKHVREHGNPGLECYKLISTRADELLYSDGGIKKYQGMEITESNMARLHQTYILPDGNVWDDREECLRPLTKGYKNKGSTYTRYSVSIQYGNEAMQKIHHLVHCAREGMPLDHLKLLTRNERDWCNWYKECNNPDIQMIRDVRSMDKAFQWSIDHIDDRTKNNRFENLQLISKHANSVLRAIRRSGFEMTTY